MNRFLIYIEVYFILWFGILVSVLEIGLEDLCENVEEVNCIFVGKLVIMKK